MQGPSGWIRYLDAYVVDANTGEEKNIYPWGPGDDEYSLPPVTVQDTITVASNTGSGTLSKKPSEGTLFLEASRDGSAWTKIAEVDRRGVICRLPDYGNSVIGMVDRDLNYVVSFGGTVPPQVRWTYRENVEKNIPFGGTANGQTYNTMQFKITKQPIEAKTRKLGASYSYELMEDYKNEFGENFEDKMVDYLTTSILTEIDGETINMLFNEAKYTDEWDAAFPGTWTQGIQRWYETLLPVVNLLSAQIYQNTHVGGITFMVCNPMTASIIQSMQMFQGVGNPADTNMSVESVKIGTLSGMYNVYVSPLCPADQILLGFKGTKPEETGAVYAPYVPIQLHPNYFAEGIPSIVARSRYWLGMLRPDYYAVIKVQNLGTFQLP